MYDYIKGKLVSKQPASSKGAAIVVDNNNMGYLIHTTNRNIALAKEEGSDIKVYTSLIHREDRDIFNILLSVSGVGMKVALVLLDEFSGYDLISAVIRGDFKELSRAKGVGSKLAQKIILELKDKLINWQKSSPVDVSDISSTQREMSEESLSEAQAVLLSLGYSVAEAKGAIKMACQSVTKSDSSEEILKEALRYLAME